MGELRRRAVGEREAAGVDGAGKAVCHSDVVAEPDARAVQQARLKVLDAGM